MTHRGWKAIANRLAVKDIRTAQKYVRRFSIPVTKECGTVCLEEELYLEWKRENLRIVRGAVRMR